MYQQELHQLTTRIRSRLIKASEILHVTRLT